MSYEQVFKEASEKLPRERLIKCACDCALINIDLIKPYTEEFELIKSFLANPENFDAAAVVAVWAAAANAADAAWAAANAADAAADAYAAYAADIAAFSASRISKASKQKVDQLINDMLSEVKEC
jgi:hypothetical protein